MVRDIERDRQKKTERERVVGDIKRHRRDRGRVSDRVGVIER